MRHIGIKLAFLAFAMALPAAAWGATLSWTATPNSVALAPLQTVTISLYLNETGSPAVIAPESGLYSVGYSITRASGDATITAFAPNMTAFPNVVSNSFNSTGASFTGDRLTVSGNSGPLPDGSGNIPLGSLQLTGGLLGSTFSFADFGAGNQTVTYDGAGSLDALIQNGSITTVVPEPTAIAALALLVPLMWRRGRAGRIGSAEK